MYTGKQFKNEAGNKVSRQVECGTRQRVRMKDERNTQAVQLYSETQDANVNTMWNYRGLLGIDNAALPNNVAWSGNAYARSGLNGHSEHKAIMLNLGMQNNGNIHVHTERQPCRDCEHDLRTLENNITGRVFAHYLVPYTGLTDLAALKTVYRNNNNIP